MDDTKKASKLFFDLQLTLTVDMTTYLVDYLPLNYGTCMKGSCIQETKVIASRSNIIAASNTIKVIVTKNTLYFICFFLSSSHICQVGWTVWTRTVVTRPVECSQC